MRQIYASVLTAVTFVLAAQSPVAAQYMAVAKDSLTAMELDRGDSLEFTWANGGTRTLALEETWADVILPISRRPDRDSAAGERCERIAGRHVPRRDEVSPAGPRHPVAIPGILLQLMACDGT